MNNTAPSTMMAEYYALSKVMREVIPLRELIKVVLPHCGFEQHHVTKFKTTVWEDNNGCITLANLEPGQTTPRSKFYNSKKYTGFGHTSNLRVRTDGPIVVIKVDTKDQLADIFTKALGRIDFVRLRQGLMGW